MKTQHGSAADKYNEAMSRRHFLRGLGACVALPAFGSLASGKALAALSPDAKLAVTASFASGARAASALPDAREPKAGSATQAPSPRRKWRLLIASLYLSAAEPCWVFIIGP